ncbi:MAG: roadblock/LC7 domain-containing protein [Actinomycetota bacterium]|nr:roadblock/LC7 domain-containing protein [Actinomycetota bacterium]
MSKAEQLAAVLDEFLSVSPDVEAAAVVSSDGLPMASALPPHVEEDRLAAMSAALLTLGERAAQGLDKGDLAQVYVEGSDGNVVLMAAGQYAVLVAMTAKHAKAGLVLFEMRQSAARVTQVMESRSGFRPGDSAERLDAVSSPAVDPTPPQPVEPGPYTAPAEPQRPAWEDEPVQATPEWEVQPAHDDEGGEAQGEEEPHREEHQPSEHSEQWQQW